jgi:hypothetical protein
LETARVLARLERVAALVSDPEGSAGYRREWRSILSGLGLDPACLRL